MDKNICRFTSSRSSNDRIHIINYVLETKPQTNQGLKLVSSYRVHLVVSGEATIVFSNGSHQLRKGDLFFGIPYVPYAIESGEDFEYIYISFLGSRANEIMEFLKNKNKNIIFHDMDALIPMWQEGLLVNQEIFALRSESVLLYSLSFLGDTLYCQEDNQRTNSEPARIIKKYLDDHFAEPDLSLNKVGAACSYNPKYVSTVFKNEYKIGFSEYLNTVRIQHAYVLIEQGFTSIKNIAAHCGFQDPMYFSKVFRTKIGISPREYIADKLHIDIASDLDE